MNSSMEKNEDSLPTELKENMNLLREITFFSLIPLEALKVLAYLSTREIFNPGDLLFSQGDDDGQAFYFISGQADLIHKGESGEKVLRSLGEGDFTGSFALLSSLQRIFSLKATAKTTCLTLSRKKFRTTMEQFPSMSGKVIKAVIDSISSWDRRFLSAFEDGCDNCTQMVGISLL